jgi:hypothetical protein
MYLFEKADLGTQKLYCCNGWGRAPSCRRPRSSLKDGDAHGRHGYIGVRSPLPMSVPFLFRAGHMYDWDMVARSFVLTDCCSRYLCIIHVIYSGDSHTHASSDVVAIMLPSGDQATADIGLLVCFLVSNRVPVVLSLLLHTYIDMSS